MRWPEGRSPSGRSADPPAVLPSFQLVGLVEQSRITPTTQAHLVEVPAHCFLWRTSVELLNAPAERLGAVPTGLSKDGFIILIARDTLHLAENVAKEVP